MAFHRLAKSQAVIGDYEAKVARDSLKVLLEIGVVPLTVKSDADGAIACRAPAKMYLVVTLINAT